MKRKKIDDKFKIKGYYVTEFTRGFFGDQNEGMKMLRVMGLNTTTIPFSIAVFFQNRRIRWKDCNGKAAYISYRLKPGQLECFGSYLGKKKSIRVFCEWGANDSPEMISRLESEAIGDLCMRCIYENLEKQSNTLNEQ